MNHSSIRTVKIILILFVTLLITTGLYAQYPSEPVGALTADNWTGAWAAYFEEENDPFIVSMNGEPLFLDKGYGTYIIECDDPASFTYGWYIDGVYPDMFLLPVEWLVNAIYSYRGRKCFASSYYSGNGYCFL